MSNEDGGKVEDQDPRLLREQHHSGWVLPALPRQPDSIDPEPEADETADPWSSTWDDTSWQLPDSDSSEVCTRPRSSRSTRVAAQHPAPTGATPTTTVGSRGAGLVAIGTANGWEAWEPSSAMGFDPDTGHWSDLQHNAETDARSSSLRVGPCRF